MGTKLIQWGKQVVVVLLIGLLLQATGLWGDLAFVSQSAAMKTGLLDAQVELHTGKNPIPFDYNFSIKDLDGNRLSFEQFRGKVVFLNLWATWCGPCRAEMPTIQSLYGELGTDSVKFVILSMDRDSDKEKIVRYVKKNSYTFPVYQPSGYLTEQLSVPSIPTTFVISKEGKVVAHEVGTTNFNTSKFKRFIRDLIAK